MTFTDNVPLPVDCSIPAFGSPDSQMSFTERIVLEGLLDQIKPALAIEIGTAAGGSLRTIAHHASEVHSFDLAPVDGPLVPGVQHVGDSKDTLPAYLDSDDTPIDFALVDGDHSADGVMTDLSNLVNSPRCADTVILAHDSANGEVRRGIESGLIGVLAYVDLDFLPGYTFLRGVFAGQTWGGFSLIVMGAKPTQPLARWSQIHTP
jgi:hypothetical protein